MLPPLPLSDSRALDERIVGPKAARLARMVRAGLPVPEGMVLPVACLVEHLKEHGLLELARSIERAPNPNDVEQLRASLMRTTVDDGALRRWVRQLGGSVAVRSSARAEDSGDRSFAGQHETVLGANATTVGAAVLTCWASLWSPAALAYRRRGPPPEMAVLVQRMVVADTAGVLFTVNPMNGSWREMVVEATFGLAVGLMDGQVAPHWFLVRRPRPAPRPFGRVLERVRLQVMQEETPEIPTEWTVRQDGLSEQPVRASRRGGRTLERSALFRVCRLGLRAERLFGEPVDVEWVVDGDGHPYLVQARPITSVGAPRVRKDVLWTRRFVGERWPEPATPCGWSLMEPLLTWFIAYPDTQARFLGGGPALRLHRSRPYVNATVFRHLAFKVPGGPPPRFMVELIPPEEEREWRRRFAVKPDFSVYASILKETWRDQRWRRFRFNPLTNHWKWDELQLRLEAELPRLRTPAETDAEGLLRVDAVMAWVREYITVHVTSLLFAHLYYQLLEASLAVWAPTAAKRLREGLALCPPGNLTLATNEALWELARLATPDDLEALKWGNASGTFGRAVEVFLDRFGHRSVASWEVFSPRWKRHPELLVPLLQAQRDTEHPATRAAAQQRVYAEALTALRDAIDEPLPYVLVRVLTYYTRRYLLLRENQRFWFDHLLDALQGHLLGLGSRFAQRGWIAVADDVAYLTWSEIRGLASGTLAPDAARDWVARRRAQREADAATEPPTFLVGDEGAIEAMAGARVEGLGISPGRARGAVRVLQRADQGGRLASGDILVARAVDPSWTPLLRTAGGLVLEMGSVLSHGAVVAREYGLPGVVNVDGATRRFRDGQEVTVDGTRGIVWVH